MNGLNTIDRRRSLRRICCLVVLVLGLALVGGTAGEAKALNPNQTTVAGVVDKTLPDLSSVWWQVFRDSGWSHLWGNTGVGLYNPGPYTNYFTACGMYPPIGNAVYCTNDHSIYVDQTWVQRFMNRYGDGAAAMLIAHEFGHHVAHLQGYPLGLAAELNADCLAGIYFRWGITRSQVLASGDLSEARTLIWNELGGDPHGHGTAQQRLAWFDYGYRSYDLASCNRAFGG